MQKASVYALVDPRDDIIRYVGVSVDPHARYKQHISSLDTSANAEKTQWIKDLKAEGLKPQLSILEDQIEHENREKREKEWIKSFIKSDVPLFNKDGRPDRETMTRSYFYLPDELREFAAVLGDGVMAEGVRRALEQAKDQTDND